MGRSIRDSSTKEYFEKCLRDLVYVGLGVAGIWSSGFGGFGLGCGGFRVQG